MIRRRPRRQRFKGLSINRMIPNMLTLFALCAGMTAIRFAIQERWEAAVAAICIAAVFDALDGRIARLLKGASRFGAELDSLSDFLCFGAAPAIVMYLWSLQTLGTAGWIPALLFAICTALRLARFNVALDEPVLPPWAFNFFSGVPSPAGGGLAIMPLIVALEFPEVRTIAANPLLTGAVLVVVAGLMVSRLPTFSLKKFKVPHLWILPLMLILGLLAAGVVVAPLKTLALMGLAYIVALPFGYLSYRRLERMADAIQNPGAAPSPTNSPTAAP
ncbi:MAG: phosphatidylcholine/phosphatidylserine synthase [Alphaproteobacteria bacterium]|nr:phosphatidylcholine/phosphatidylserine synthase [Alphaproteobacteria bacterium]